ncbi:hypothetical protein Misp03_14990 [Microbispora sp. NBRC 16548]|nr:hypothetical protein Misp03_14990 [Microbispora sp. NBRC 16548]
MLEALSAPLTLSGMQLRVNGKRKFLEDRESALYQGSLSRFRLSGETPPDSPTPSATPLPCCTDVRGSALTSGYALSR